jgi:hypothetical protein
MSNDSKILGRNELKCYPPNAKHFLTTAYDDDRQGQNKKGTADAQHTIISSMDGFESYD